MFQQMTSLPRLTNYEPLLTLVDDVERELDEVASAGRGVDPSAYHDNINKAYLPHLDNMARIQIFYGGSGSGKSVFLSQRDVLDLLKGGRNFLICRQVAKTLRKSVFAEVCKVITDWELTHRFSIQKTDMTITCDNGYQMLFVGLDDTEKLKSITPQKGVITDVRVEEATETEQSSIKQLFKRQRGGNPDVPKRLTLSFNPIIQLHWIYIEYFAAVAWADDQTEHNDGRLSILKTWYIHNEYLTEDDVNDLLTETDEYYRDVYTFGNWGVLGNVIFKNWEIQDLSDMADQFINHRFGLDFGFSIDPAAIVMSHYDKKKKTIYIYNEFYEAGLTNDVLAQEVIDMLGTRPIICDSAEPKSIAELRQHGVSAYPAKKGKDSVMHGIQWLQQQRIIIDKSCINTRNEFLQYKWKEDKDGVAMRQPLDQNNHIIDGLRYAYEDDYILASTKLPPQPTQTSKWTSASGGRGKSKWKL